MAGIALTVVTASLRRERYEGAVMVVETQCTTSAGRSVEKAARTARLGREDALTRCWDTLFDAVLRAQEAAPDELRLEVDSGEIPEWAQRIQTLAEIVAYELKVPFAGEGGHPSDPDAVPSNQLSLWTEADPQAVETAAESGYDESE